MAAAAAAAVAAVLGAPAGGGVAATLGGPQNTGQPTISGTAVEGNTLAASSGTWTGSPPISFAYQWQRCPTSACTDIAGATGQTYTIAHADVGAKLLVVVTATDASGPATAASAPTSAVAAASPPASTAPPTIGGTARVGQTLTASEGTWTGNPPPSFAYAWQRCNSAGASCATIAAQTARTYAVVAADIGSRLRVSVSATNASGAASALSAATDVVTDAPSAPAARSQPNISGTLRIGQALSVQTGDWNGTPPFTYSFAWQRCTSAGLCTTIAGAAQQTYVPTPADVGFRLRALVGATNGAGSNSVYSNLTVTTIAGATPAPVMKTAPWVSGLAKEGSTVSVSGGSWTTTPTKIAYAWLRCDTRGSSCTTISGATGSTYALTRADAGRTVRVQVTATNAGGSTSATSVPTPTIAAQAGAVAGASLVKLADGTFSVPVADVALPQRLIISRVSFSPQRLTSRAPFTGRFRVTDSRGYAVRDALVYVLALPYGLVAPSVEARTDVAGYATVELRPSSQLSLRRGAVVLFVRARKPAESLLGGISTRRLVQIGVGR